MLHLFPQDARRVLEKIRLPEEDVEAELKEIAATVAEERAAIAGDSGMLLCITHAMLPSSSVNTGRSICSLI